MRLPAWGMTSGISARAWRSGRTGQRGGAVAEFVLVMPLLMLLIFGMFVVGTAVTAKGIVQGAARDAAHEFAVTGSYASAANTARDVLRLGGLDGIVATVSIQENVPASGLVTVTVQHPYRTLLGGTGVLERTLPLTGRAVFRMRG